MEKVCPEKTRLLNAYQETAIAHSTAVTHLRHNMRTLKKGEYDAAYADAERLRMASRLAQEALDAHLIKCDECRRGMVEAATEEMQKRERRAGGRD